MISVFELFKIGVGPSSSHTVGPMKAALAFAEGLPTERVARVRATLLGSLAFTGKGHATDRAVLLGLAGEAPDTLDADRAEALIADAASRHVLPLAGPAARSRFDPAADIVFDFVTSPPRHPNTMRFEAFDASGAAVAGEIAGCRSAAGSSCARARRAAWPGRGAPIPIRSATRSNCSTRPRRRA